MVVIIGILSISFIISLITMIVVVIRALKDKYTRRTFARKVSIQFDHIPLFCSRVTQIFCILIIVLLFFLISELIGRIILYHFVS